MGDGEEREGPRRAKGEAIKKESEVIGMVLLTKRRFTEGTVYLGGAAY